MIRTTVDDATTQLHDLVKAALEGEEVFIAADDAQGERVLQLILLPAQRPKGRPKAGSAKGLFIMTDEFDEPLEDFEEYMR